MALKIGRMGRLVWPTPKFLDSWESHHLSKAALKRSLNFSIFMKTTGTLILAHCVNISYDIILFRSVVPMFEYFKIFQPPKKMTSKFYMQDIIMFFDSWQFFHPNFWEKKCLVSMWKNQNSYIVSTYRPWWWFLTGSTFFPQIFGEKCDPKWWLQNRYVVPTCRT